MREYAMQEYAKVNAKQPFIEFVEESLNLFRMRYAYAPSSMMLNSVYSEDGVIEAEYTEFRLIFTKIVARSSIRFGPVIKKRYPRISKEIQREPSI